jgi:DNA mismatch repair protein MutS
MLDESRQNYLAAIYIGDEGAAISYADISTGEAAVVNIASGDDEHRLDTSLQNELSALSPSEAILGGRAAAEPYFSQLEQFLREKLLCFASADDKRFEHETSGAALKRSGSAGDFAGASATAAGALLSYLEDTQRGILPKIKFRDNGETMKLDIGAIRGLELVASSASGERRGSLLWVLDKTRTAMGRRLLRSWVLRPMTSVTAIRRRLDAVETLFRETVRRGEITHALRDVGDIERLTGKLTYGTANARDLLALASSISALEELPPNLDGLTSSELRDIAAFDRLQDIRDEIMATIAPEPPVNVREGGIIRDGRDAEIDRMRGLVRDGGGAMAEIERRERERTGIRLKVGYNRVFGYYIEMPRSKSEDVPEGYERRQTLATTERFITPELKKLETELLSARESVTILEYNLFRALAEKLAGMSERLTDTAGRLARLDALCSLAEVAAKNNYARPEVTAGAELIIKDGRHPVVELTHTDSLFVPNDTYLDDKENIAMVITGPNMAGKSTYMRQTALITLMAQIGSFVPAASAEIGVVDRIFTRIGASDDLASGKSTFMVEMTESAEILRNATRRSLIILDELGRGTSTYDGVAIARAILEYCADRRRLGAKTLFSTHYHELIETEAEFPGVKCYAITAKRRGEELVFLRKITRGGAHDSYGIDVAKLAGLPSSVVKRAREVMRQLTTDNSEQITDNSYAGRDDGAGIAKPMQISMTDVRADKVSERLRELDLNTLTPLEAMNLLYELKKELDI